MDSELMLDCGLSIREDQSLMLKKSNIIESTTRSHPMKLQMVMKKRTLKIRTRMILMIQFFKTMDLVQMPDSGPSTKDQRQGAITTFNYKSHQMRLQTEMQWKIETSKMKEMMMMLLFKTLDLASMHICSSKPKLPNKCRIK